MIFRITLSSVRNEPLIGPDDTSAGIG